MSLIKSISQFFESFFKTNWVFEDYSVQVGESFNYNNTLIKYFAKFTNGSVITLGSTPEEATQRLKDYFNEYKKNKRLPRPGTPARFLNPATKKSEKYETVAMHFFRLIGEDQFTQIDDEFTVGDFQLSSNSIKKIEQRFGIRVKDDDILVDIFEQISNDPYI